MYDISYILLGWSKEGATKNANAAAAGTLGFGLHRQVDLLT